jgi:hypothetical protein
MLPFPLFGANGLNDLILMLYLNLKHKFQPPNEQRLKDTDVDALIILLLLEQS